MAPEIKFVALSNGVTLPFVEQGSPSGIPVVFLHGITDSWRSFEGVLEHLPRSIRAFALTVRGHGDADRPESGYTPRDFAADVVTFMDAVGVESAVVVGHSMGSYIAQRVAIDYPDRVRGLVLLGSCASMAANASVSEFAKEVATLEDPIDPDFARDFQVSTVARPVPEALIDMAVGESLKVPARVWRAAFAGLVEGDHGAEVGRIAAPTLVMWGDQDAYFLRSHQEELLAAIPDSELVVYEGGGHAPHWEEPEVFAADVAVFAERVPEPAFR
jgi:non-heme chloroperoxidase